jgi:hypothetical protein
MAAEGAPILPESDLDFETSAEKKKKKRKSFEIVGKAAVEEPKEREERPPAFELFKDDKEEKEEKEESIFLRRN